MTLTACSKRASRASSAAIVAALAGSTDDGKEGSAAAESNGIADCTPLHGLMLRVLATAVRGFDTGVSAMVPPEPGGGSMVG